MQLIFILGYFFYLFPIAVVVALRFLVGFPLRLAILLMLAASLVGEGAYLLSRPDFLGNAPFWGTLFGSYPFAVMPLGFWAAFMGGVAWLGLKRSRLAQRLGRCSLAGLMTVGCAVAGAVVLPPLVYLMGLSQAQPGSRVLAPGEFVAFAAAGAAAGAVSGVMIALSQSRGRSVEQFSKEGEPAPPLSNEP